MYSYPNKAGKRLRYFTGCSVPVALWNDKEQRVRSARQFPQSSEINDILTTLTRAAEMTYLSWRNKGKDLTVEQFKLELDQATGKIIHQPEDDTVTFEKYSTQFIREREANPDYSRGSIVVYRNCVKHVKSFASASRRSIDFEDFDYAFFADFTNYLFAKNFGKNYVHKITSTLKTILREAERREISPDLKYKSDWIQVSREEPPKIYLTEEELGKIASLDFSNNPRLDRVRDLFLLGCFTGLRYSDYGSLKPEHIISKNGRQFIDILTQKTRQRVMIPLRQAVVDMFQKYDGVPPQGITNQKANEYLKELGELAGIDDSEQYALVATEDGWYPCLHSGRKSIYLRMGEVWKYGITSKGQIGRYTTSFLLKNNVSYFLQFRGNFAECLKQEQIKLYNYPYLPENLARPPSERLPRPPYNSVMR